MQRGSTPSDPNSLAKSQELKARSPLLKFVEA
jgi:hypothetical protein